MANPNWVKGMESPNPGGREPSVFQDWDRGVENILKKYSRSEIIALSEDPVRLDKEVSSFYALIVEQLASAYKKSSGLEERQFTAIERERLLDRGRGKPKQSTEHSGSIGLADLVAASLNADKTEKDG